MGRYHSHAEVPAGHVADSLLDELGFVAGQIDRSLDNDMEGGQYTALGIALALHLHPSPLVGMARGVYCYLPAH